MKHPRLNRSAFTLMEVILSMAVFLIGMVAVAAIFPAATRLQVQTQDDVLTQLVAKNAQALVTGKPLPHHDLAAFVPPGTNVHTVPPDMPWSLHDRGYPSTLPVGDQDFYWVPLVRRRVGEPTGIEQWQVFVFILRNRDDTYDLAGATEAYEPINDQVPHVVSADIKNFNGTQFFFDNDHWPAPNGDGVADQVRPGDSILDNNGTIYVVTEATAGSVTVSGFIAPNPNTPFSIRYGRPAEDGRPSPARRIIALSGGVK